MFNNRLCCFRHATAVREVSPRHGRGATRKAEYDTRLVPAAQVQHELVEVFIKTLSMLLQRLTLFAGNECRHSSTLCAV